ncbi:MAG TPA: PAS domain S-box protein, partial [Alkalispirochaeta sp.]|nr:PAS domain S-box protein [Alkalispirochaeta sp.]
MARSAASTALVIGVLAAARLGTFLPTANVAPADGITTSAILKATFAVLTALVLLVIALWPEKRVRALQSLPGSALVVLVVGIGLLFIYEILDVTQTVMGEAPSSVLTGLEEAARLSGVIALLGAIFLWIRDLLRTRDQLGISAEMARQREADFRDLFELYPDPALLIDPETARLVRFNTAAYRQLGYTAEEFAQLRVDDFEAAMTVEEITHHIRVTLEHGRDDFETRHRRRDGTVTDVHVSLVSLKTQEPTQLLAVFRDITSHKHALRDLAESERRFADVAVAAGEYIWEIDTSGTYTSITPAVEPLLGYSMEEILGHSPYDFMPTDEAARVQELLHVYAAEKSSWQGLEHVSVRSDGTVVHQRVSGLPIIDATGELLGFRGTGRDITAEKNAETAHRALSERLELATESAGLGIWDYDITSGRLDWDDRMFQLYGIDPSDFSHGLDDWTRHQLPQSRETAISRFTAAIESGTTFEAEITIERPKDGEIRILQGQAQVIRDSNGRAVRVVGINRDITQQEENRRRLSSEEAKFRTLFELAPVGIAMNDFATGEFLRFNHAVNEPAGYTQEEFAALSYWDVTPPEYEADEQAQIASMQRTGRYGPFHKEYIRKDGTRYPVLLHGFKFTTPEGHDVIWSIVQDVSEQHAAERALRAAKERFQGIFEQTSSGVAVYRPVDGGADLEFVDYNPAAEHMDQTPK